ncbi:MAG: phosphotransferase family protein [Burkholderiaceae bacterium]
MPNPSLTIDRIHTGLQRYFDTLRGRGCRIERLQVMEAGHAGLTFGFELAGPSVDERRGLILKLAPPGVRRAGNTDVYRQAPLLRTMFSAGLQVPDVPFASEDEQWFGTAFIIMDRLAGAPFFVWQPDPAFDRSPAAVAALWTQTIDAMIGFHRLDWRSTLGNWEAPRRLDSELAYWDPILAKAPEPAWITAGRSLCERLRCTLPADAPLGLVHGDCQPGNVLFDDGRLTGVIDWELASIGCRWIDVGWMMMLADRDNWPPGWRPLCPLSPAQIAARYADAMGESRDGLDWFQAFAGYRLGAIACLNVRLHRSGRRHDPTWEHFADAIPSMFERASALAANLPRVHPT